MRSSCPQHVLRTALEAFYRKPVRIFLEQEVTYAASEIYRRRVVIIHHLTL
jgi:hypothetical protein